MDALPDKIYSVAAVREIDRIAIEEHGVPGYTLMTRAAAAALEAIRQRFPGSRRWQVVCGAGNNAGDGYVLARLAAAEGIDLSVVALADPGKLRGDAATAFADWTAHGGCVAAWEGALDDAADLVVDAMLGSGLERNVEASFAAAVAACNAHPGVRVALDLPTGLHGDTGEVMGSAVRATLTVTFVALKSGLFLGAGPEHCGELVFAGLQIDAAARTALVPDFRRMDDTGLRAALPRRQRAAHKGDFGHLLLVGGGAGMPGAIRLCGEAALRSGAGRVSIATDPGHAAIIVATRPELMSHGIEDVAALEALLQHADVIAFGPGLGRSEWARSLHRRLAGDGRPAVWDADALYWLAAEPDKSARRIITPHPGEAAALLGCSVAEVQADRIAAVAALQERYGGVAVLKGAGSLVAGAAKPPWLCTSGNPGMATAGSGDVLTGIIAGCLGQGLEPELAAATAVEVHARAGDLAASRGERGMLASDISAALPAVVNPASPPA